MSLRRTQPVLRPGTRVRLPSGHRVQVQSARTGKGVREPELLCRYLHPRHGYPLSPGRLQRNELWLTQRFVLAWGEMA